MALPHFINIESHKNGTVRWEPVHSNLFEIEFTSETRDLSHFTESAKKYELKRNLKVEGPFPINQITLDVWFNTNVNDDDEMLIMKWIGEKIHIKLKIHDKKGIVFHVEEGDFILSAYGFHQNWEDNMELMDAKVTFVASADLVESNYGVNGC